MKQSRKYLFGIVMGIIIFFLIRILIDQEGREIKKDVFNRIKKKIGVERKVTSQMKINKKLSLRQQQIMEIFSKTDKVYMDNLTKILKNIHVRTIRRDLASLSQLGYIKKVGGTKGRYYVLCRSVGK